MKKSYTVQLNVHFQDIEPEAVSSIEEQLENSVEKVVLSGIVNSILSAVEERDDDYAVGSWTNGIEVAILDEGDRQILSATNIPRPGRTITLAAWNDGWY